MEKLDPKSFDKILEVVDKAVKIGTELIKYGQQVLLDLQQDAELTQEQEQALDDKIEKLPSLDHWIPND